MALSEHDLKRLVELRPGSAAWTNSLGRLLEAARAQGREEARREVEDLRAEIAHLKRHRSDLWQTTNRYQERYRKAEAALKVIGKAAFACRTAFGGSMTEVSRVFQEIVRVARVG